jgi:Serine carboxypeptidase
MAIGNGFMSMSHLTNSLQPFIYYHGITSFEAWTKMNQACCNGTVLPYCDFYSQIGACPNQPCNKACNIQVPTVDLLSFQTILLQLN